MNDGGAKKSGKGETGASVTEAVEAQAEMMVGATRWLVKITNIQLLVCVDDACPAPLKLS